MNAQVQLPEQTHHTTAISACFRGIRFTLGQQLGKKQHGNLWQV